MEATRYRVTVEPVGNFDPALYVRPFCGAESCLAGTVLTGPGKSETVTFDVGAGESAFIVVDGEWGSSGAYTLIVERL